MPALSLSSAVKRNPLFVDSASANSQPSEAEPIAIGSTNEAVFYGQRTNIRRTKQKEMVSAIMDLARYGTPGFIGVGGLGNKVFFFLVLSNSLVALLGVIRHHKQLLAA